MTTFADQVYQWGGVPLATAAAMFGPKAKTYFVDPTNGSDTNEGTDIMAPLATLLAAYNKTVSGQNDVIYYLAGTSSLTLSAALTWSNSYTHLFGVCAPVHVGQRARIFQLSTLTGASPLITISGSGCIFKNLYIFQGVDDNTSLINVRVTGGRNYFENVHFAGGGHATQAINGGASLHLYQSASENLFRNCTIGVDTVEAATGMDALLLSGGTGSVHTTRNRFEHCTFRIKAGAGGVAFVELMTIYDIDRDLVFEDCIFENLAATAIDSAFVVPAGFDKNDKRILLRNCLGIGASKWDANDRGAVYGNMNAVTGADLSGVAVEMIS